MSSERRLPRWAKRVAVIVVALLLVFYGAGGIVFSNMLHSDALLPLPPTGDFGVYVREQTGDSITLTSSDERDDTTQPGVAGLAWAGGYGRLGDITAIEGLDVTRGFEIVRGEPPPLCPTAVADCEAVDIEGWTYPSDPSDVGLGFDETSFESPLGTIGAWQVAGGDGMVWAIHVHGWRASRREAIRSLPTYHAAGATSLVIDYRNDPEAPADPSGIYRFGLSEWEDLEAAVQHALTQGAGSVVLVGYSTGAAVIMAFLERSPHADDVNAVVFDSPNIDMGSTVRLEASRRTLPGTPVPVPGSLTAVAMLISDWRWNVDWDGIDYVDRASENLTAPTLVFHGLDDDRVPVEVSRRLAAEVADRVELVEVPEAGHVSSWNIDPAAYREILGGFLEGVLAARGSNSG